VFYLPKVRFSHLFRRTAALTLVATLTVCTLGLPLPLRIEMPASKSSTEPYPCMNCPCGCKNAEMCWRNCCCQTQQEKLAWAKKNGVTPPAFVVVAAKAEQRLTRQPSAPKSTAPKCCCCKAKSCSPKPKTPVAKSSTAKSSTTSVVMFQALKCQGLAAHWVFLSPPLPDSDAVFTLELLPFERVITLTPIFSSHLSQPATPPPDFC